MHENLKIVFGHVNTHTHTFVLCSVLVALSPSASCRVAIFFLCLIVSLKYFAIVSTDTQNKHTHSYTRSIRLMAKWIIHPAFNSARSILFGCRFFPFVQQLFALISIPFEWIFDLQSLRSIFLHIKLALVSSVFKSNIVSIEIENQFQYLDHRFSRRTTIFEGRYRKPFF